ncbi:MAG: hypothetical protein K6T35_01855 [Meiothermus silvanus]|nr:hypothetical protein [Allomeiothermus silvanus]
MTGPFLTVTLLSDEHAIVNMATIAKVEPIVYRQRQTGENAEGARLYSTAEHIDPVDVQETVTQLAERIRHAL